MANTNNPIQKTVQEMSNNSYDTTFNQNTVETVGFDGTNLQRKNADALLTEIDYLTGTIPIYVGIAAPGSATSAAVWQIKKITYDANSNPTVVQYANGSSNFNAIWDDRVAGYTYS